MVEQLKFLRYFISIFVGQLPRSYSFCRKDLSFKIERTERSNESVRRLQFTDGTL
jgi:hypothetical protein